MNNKTSAAMKRFNHLANEMDRAYHEVSLKLGLSDSAMMILYTVCDSGGSCMLSEICGLSGMSKQTVNSALRRLEAEGVLYLEAQGGKRKRVVLTEEGKQLTERTVLRVIEAENSILSSWSEEDREKYLGLTQRYLDEFREHAKKF